MVDYITYKGVKYPVSIVYIALAGFEEEVGEFFALGISKTKNYNILLWHSLIAGGVLLNKPFIKVEKDAEGKEIEVPAIPKSEMNLVLETNDNFFKFNPIVLEAMIKYRKSQNLEAEEDKKK